MGKLRNPDQRQASARFSADEPGSFCSRETPVVPVPKEVFLEAFAAGSPADEAQPADQSHSSQQNGSSEATPATSSDPASAVTAPQSPSIRVSDEEFWERPPVYSVAPRSLWPRTPPRRPSAIRSWLARLLFVLILVPILLLFAHMVSIEFGIEWLDVPALMRWMERVSDTAAGPT